MEKSHDGQFALRPYRLALDGKSLCVLLGGFYNNTYWALISSLAPGDARKHSPGDNALRQMFASLCGDGAVAVDFSAGDTAYKLHWADYKVPFRMLIRAKTAKGLALCVVLLAKHSAKRFLKKNVMVRDSLFAIRRLMIGRKNSS